MANPYRPLAVVIESAEGLEYVNTATQMKPYAVVYMYDVTNNLRSSRKISSADGKGGSNPTWNFHVMFNIDMAKAEANGFALVVKLRSRRIPPGGARDKTIGQVLVPINELRDVAEGKEKGTRMTKAVCTFPDGGSGAVKEQGKLTFSYEFREPTADNPTQLDIRKKNSIPQAMKKLLKLLGPVALTGLISGLASGFVRSLLS